MHQAVVVGSQRADSQQAGDSRGHPGVGSRGHPGEDNPEVGMRQAVAGSQLVGGSLLEAGSHRGSRERSAGSGGTRSSMLQAIPTQMRRTFSNRPHVHQL